MSFQTQRDTHSSVLMTKQDFVQCSSDSFDTLIAKFAMLSDQAQQRPIDKDFLKMSETVMKKVWDNKYDNVWDTT